ncbi:MAG: cation transporter [Bacilli bacterium]|nr:cation transporter [Bacilli bacterium]MBN2877139.1 cation transporter [Bacilli bacterium]
MKSEKRILLSFILNLLFTIFEFIGGLITNSIALLSDSVHDLGDSLSMGIAMVLEKKSKKKPDDFYTYGYRRYSLLGALISSLILLVGSVFIIIEAVKRLMNPEAINAQLVIYFSIVGILVNGLAAWNVSKGKTLNEKVISLHLLEDILGWVALFITAIIMVFTDIIALDAILSIAFTLFICYQVFKNIRSVFFVLLEKAPKGFDLDKIKSELERIEHVREIHHIHLWSLEGSFPLITLHALLEENLDSETITDIQQEIYDSLHHFGILHSTIQIEFNNSPCGEEECPEPEVEEHLHHHH